MKRRIVVLNERDPRNPLAGGAEVHVFEIFSRLVRRGHDVTLLAAGFAGGAAEETVDGVRVRRLANRYGYYALVGREARREAEEGAEIVVDVLNKLPFLSPWTLSLPCLVIVHHLFGTTAFRQAPFLVAGATWLAERLIPHAYRRTPMLAISPSTKADLVARGVAADRVWVVPPGIDDARYLPGAAPPPARPLAVWVGRLEPYKRADVVLEAMVGVHRRVPEAELVIVGEGSVRGELEQGARERGLGEAVRFTGYVSEADKIAWLQRATVVVQTSEKEGWGMTMIEGNACGAPAVASDVPGLRDSVRDGESGLLVPYADSAALAAALAEVLGDRELHARLRRGGLQWAARFSWEKVADDVEALLEEAVALAAGRGASRPRLALGSSPFAD